MKEQRGIWLAKKKKRNRNRGSISFNWGEWKNKGGTLKRGDWDKREDREVLKRGWKIEERVFEKGKKEYRGGTKGEGSLEGGEENFKKKTGETNKERK